MTHGSRGVEADSLARPFKPYNGPTSPDEKGKYAMKWSSKVSEQFNTKDAIDECVAHIKADLGGEAPDLAVMFASAHHSPDFDDMPALLGERAE